MRLKKIILTAMAVITAISIVGCGAGSGNTSTGESSTNVQQQKPDAGGSSNFADALTVAPTGKKITVVTNNGTNGRDVWLLEHATEAGFNIEIVNLGGGDGTARVISEVNNPTTNVIWGPSEEQFNSMVAAGALVKFRTDWAEDVAGLSKENGYSWPYEIQPKLLVANPDIYTEETAPKNYRDLWENEEFHGKYAVPTKFDGNTPRAIVGGILAQYLDPNGELGVSEDGWKAIKAYFDNGYKTQKGENDFENMASGKVPITFTYASGLKGKSESFNVNPIIIYTEAGEPTNTNQIGVVANKDQELVDESMRFANWLGSADIIGAYANANGNMVANKQAEGSMVPVIKEVKEKYKPQDADWGYVNSMMDDWIAKIQLEIY